MLCDYFCGQEAKFQLKNGKWCCSEHYSSCPENRRKNSAGLKKAHKEGRMRTDQFDKDGVRNWSKGKTAYSDSRIRCKYNKHNMFSKNTNPTGKHKEILIKEGFVEYKCSVCGISEWNEKPLMLQLDHINGDRYDNSIENLRLICPNCHSQTDTYCNKGGWGSQKVSDNEIISAMLNSPSKSQFFLKIGLVDHKCNYNRMKNIINYYNLDIPYFT